MSSDDKITSLSTEERVLQPPEDGRDQAGLHQEHGRV